jgi:hypothetical protein
VISVQAIFSEALSGCYLAFGELLGLKESYGLEGVKVTDGGRAWLVAARER